MSRSSKSSSFIATVAGRNVIVKTDDEAVQKASGSASYREYLKDCHSRQTTGLPCVDKILRA
eukprot:3191792-Lingulodinium_polyedra.AAC.1